MEWPAKSAWNGLDSHPSPVSWATAAGRDKWRPGGFLDTDRRQSGPPCLARPGDSRMPSRCLRPQSEIQTRRFAAQGPSLRPGKGLGVRLGTRSKNVSGGPGAIALGPPPIRVAEAGGARSVATAAFTRFGQPRGHAYGARDPVFLGWWRARWRGVETRMRARGLRRQAKGSDSARSPTGRPLSRGQARSALNPPCRKGHRRRTTEHGT